MHDIDIAGEKDGGGMKKKEDRCVMASIRNLLGIVHHIVKVGRRRSWHGDREYYNGCMSVIWCVRWTKRVVAYLL